MIVTFLLILRLGFWLFINMDWRSYSLVNDDWRLIILPWSWDVHWLLLGWSSILLLDRSWWRLRSWLI